MKFILNLKLIITNFSIYDIITLLWIGGLVDFMIFLPVFSKVSIHRDYGLRNAIFATNFSHTDIDSSSFWWAFLIGGRMEDFYYWKNEVED